MNSKTPNTTPAIVTELAARNIPRLLLLSLVLFYCTVGFWGREPFKPLEINQLGWLFIVADFGSPSKAIEFGFDPLLHPVGFSILANLVSIGFAPKTVFVIYQGLSLALLLATVFFTWNSARRFAGLSAAQPVTFAFGGEAKSNAYAIAIADSTVLALIACLGFSQFGHESSPFVVQIACVSGLMMSLSVTQGNGLLRLTTRGLPLIGLAYAGAPILTLMLVATLFMQSMLARSAGQRKKEILLHMILMIIVSSLVYFVFGDQAHQTIQNHQRDGFIRTFKLLVWFTWPIWPMAIWTMWKWRQHWWSTHASIHLLSPVLLSATLVLHAFWMGHNDRWYFLSLPPLALLAALALPTLTRSVSSVIDWFTMVLFTGSGLLIWLLWIAGLTGWPTSLVSYLEKSIPQFSLSPSPVQFFIAISASLAWLWLVAWRTGRHRTPLWKSLALPAGGAATCWVLMTTLWLPYLNQSRSLMELGQQLQETLPLRSCVYAWNLNQEQISALYFYGQIAHLVPSTELTPTDGCQMLFANRSSLSQNEDAIDGSIWIKFKLLVGNRLNLDDDLVIFIRR